MHVPLLPSLDQSDIYVSGDVNIHPQAVIAPGAVLQAAPEAKIVIGAGVCIGMGTVIQAHQGTVEVETGAILGAGVLLVDEVKIGSYACVGAATTVFRASVAAKAILPAGSVIGDSSRQVDLNSETEIADSQEQNQESPTPTPEKAQEPSPNSAADPPEQVSQQVVYGKVHVNSLLLKLFPNGRNLNQHPPPPDSS